MQKILTSINSYWCEPIISGKKRYEVRKSVPKCGVPFRSAIYCTVGGKTLNIPISQERLMLDCLVNGMKSMNCPIGNGKIIGEFTCDSFLTFPYVENMPTGRALLNMPEGGNELIETEPMYLIESGILEATCLDYKALEAYGNKKTLYGWHISDLVVYDEPLELAKLGVSRPPQSWCYIK